jgi:hypothetical protein
MSSSHPTGLGEPAPIGKIALFQPPRKSPPSGKKQSSVDSVETKEPVILQTSSRKDVAPKPPHRIRMTIELTRNALITLQSLQHNHRLETGKSLPIWKIISKAVEQYGRKSPKDQTILDLENQVDHQL